MTTETQPSTTTNTQLPPYSPDVLPEAFRGSETFKNFKSWDDVFKSHEEARRLIGADKSTVFRIPHGGDIPADVWKRLGKPDKYEIASGLLSNMSDSGKQAFLDAANKANLTAAQFETIQTALDNSGRADSEAASKAVALEKQAAEAQLRAQLGDAYDQNINLAKDVLVTFEHPELWDAIEKSGLVRNAGFVNLMAEIAKLSGDDKIVSGGRSEFALTPDQAAHELDAKRTDKEFMERYTNAAAPGHKEAVAEMQRLYQAKFGGKA